MPPNIANVLGQHIDALGILCFSSIIAISSLLIAPSQTETKPITRFWEDVWSSSDAYLEEVDEIVFEPTLKEIELDLPFDQVTDSQSFETAKSTLAPGWQEYTIARNDTLGAILKKIGADNDARQFLVTKKMVSYRKLRRGKIITYQFDGANNLLALNYKASSELHFSFAKDASGNFEAKEGPPTLTSRTLVSTADITEDANSLFAAMDTINVPDAIIQTVINALETRVDFVRDTRLGDSFVVVYEILHDEDNEYAGTGDLLGLHYINKNKSNIGLLNPADGKFYTPEGVSLQNAFLRSPLKFSRISSRYTNSRFHPVLKKWRSHRGVDFAAPTNTPVRASADGSVSVRGRSGGYGNLVRLEHFGKYSTLYGHLNKFSSKIKKGSKVEQGQIIGYVGSTGLATGPHLHYEFRINNKHVDPLSVNVPTNRPPLETEELKQFIDATANINEMLNKALTS